MFSADAGEPGPEIEPAPHLFSRVAERILRSNAFDDMVGALIVELPNGRDIRIGNCTVENAAPILRLNNYRVVRAALLRGGLGFAEAYINGDIECSDLTDVILFYLRNRTKLHAAGGRLFKPRSFDRLMHFLRRNSLKGSRRNISEHYDLGNAFYRLWLDSTMTYSSGCYRDGTTTLEEAQLAKMDRVRALLSPKEGDSILEIGCGWGSFARRTAALDRTCVTGLSLSEQQISYARQHAEQSGLSSLCSFQLRDYRNTNGQYDHIVSIEMVEAVGEAYWGQYFQTVYECLKPGGTAVIQAITIAPDLFDRYRRRPDFIQRYIFPGGMLPTEERIASEAERVGLKLTHAEQFGACYAKTLREWHGHFRAAWPEILKLGFDDRFRRRWQYYLSYCEAGFDHGAINVGIYRLRKQ